MGGFTWLGVDEFNTLSTLNVKVNLSSWPPYEDILSSEVRWNHGEINRQTTGWNSMVKKQKQAYHQKHKTNPKTLQCNF